MFGVTVGCVPNLHYRRSVAVIFVYSVVAVIFVYSVVAVIFVYSVFKEEQLK